MVLGVTSGFGVVLLLCCGLICLFSLYMVSGRILHTLIALEQLSVLLLLCSLIILGGCDETYFVALLVMFTVDAVVSLSVFERLWGVGNLVGLGWW